MKEIEALLGADALRMSLETRRGNQTHRLTLTSPGLAGDDADVLERVAQDVEFE